LFGGKTSVASSAQIKCGGHEFEGYYSMWGLTGNSKFAVI
jgi:hypothetical protein